MKSKTLSFLLCSAMISISCTSPGNRANPSSPLRNSQLTCPTGKRVILDNRYPEKLIFVSYWNHTPQKDLMHIISEVMRDTDVELKAIVSTEQFWQAYEFRNENLKNKHFKYLTTFSEESIWAQDYMQFTYLPPTKEVELMSMPYDETIDVVPAEIAMALGYPHLHHGFEDYSNVDSGDYGGNLEALNENIVIIGDNMGKKTQEYIKESISQKIMTINVDWLTPGHVDELFNTIPNDSECGYFVSYASPATAMELLRLNKLVKTDEFAMKDEWVDEDHIDFDPERMEFGDCLRKYSWSTDKGPQKCRELVRANNHYEERIQTDISRIKSALKETNSCTNVEFVPFPVLFAPQNIQSRYGRTGDFAIALNINSINGIYIHDHYIYGEQRLNSFANYMDKTLKEKGVKSKTIETSHLHSLEGGLHCTTNVVRTCR